MQKTRINLLPWRDTQRKEREIRFVIITGLALAFVGTIVLSGHLYMADKITYQQSRNDYLKNEIKKADAKIRKIKKLKDKKRHLVERMNVIQELEESRSHVVHLLDEFVKHIPSGVYLKRMKQKKNKITLEGVAQSDARVSSLMSSLDASPWLTNPKIYLIKNSSTKNQSNHRKRSMSSFRLVITLTTPKKDKLK
jgi:type IV pilus assembly protein PilN